MSSNKVCVSAWEGQLTFKRCCVSDRRVQPLHSKLYRPRQIDKQGSNEDIPGVSISRQPLTLSSSARVRHGDARSSRVVLRSSYP